MEIWSVRHSVMRHGSYKRIRVSYEIFFHEIEKGLQTGRTQFSLNLVTKLFIIIINCLWINLSNIAGNFANPLPPQLKQW